MVPIVICLVAVICIWYALSLEQRRMIGDETAHDPGSRAMPLAAGVLMLAAGLYETLRRPGKTAPPEEGGSAGLFILTLISSLAYIVFLERIGFIPLTSLFLYTLIAVYKSTALPGGKVTTGSFLPGFLYSATVSTLLYTAGRLVSREFFYRGRSAGIELLSSRTFTILSFTLVAGILYAGIAKLAYRRGSGTAGRVLVNSVLLSTATTLLLYVVFRMIFRVNFPAGLIFW
jgi:hypothetical protein